MVARRILKSRGFGKTGKRFKYSRITQRWDLFLLSTLLLIVSQGLFAFNVESHVAVIECNRVSKSFVRLGHVTSYAFSSVAVILAVEIV